MLVNRLKSNFTKHFRSMGNIFKFRCFEKDETIIYSISNIPTSYRQTREIIVNIYLNDVFPKLLSKCRINQIDQILTPFTDQRKISSEIDLFVQNFFQTSLLSSKKIQQAFRLEEHSTLIKLFLKNPSTRFERVNFLINRINPIFFIDPSIQRIAIRSQQHRPLIDRLIQDDKILTIEKFSDEQNPSSIIIQSQTDNLQLPGLHFNVFSTSIEYLTGKEQEHITNIIINDFIPVCIFIQE